MKCNQCGKDFIGESFYIDSGIKANLDKFADPRDAAKNPAYCSLECKEKIDNFFKQLFEKDKIRFSALDN